MWLMQDCACEFWTSILENSLPPENPAVGTYAGLSHMLSNPEGNL
jgi:hypothetical protein